MEQFTRRLYHWLPFSLKHKTALRKFISVYLSRFLFRHGKVGLPPKEYYLGCPIDSREMLASHYETVQQENPESPLVSIIIVTWNSEKYLSACLDALSTQTNKDFEIVIVDNGSTNEEYLGLKERYSDLKLTLKKLNTNLGFATANNIGTHLASGKWLAMLNADAFPESDWLEKLLNAAEKNPEHSFFSSRQIQANTPERLDGIGDAYHISGLAWRNGYNHPSATFGHEQKEVF